MPVTMKGLIRSRTDWSVVDTKASAFDHVYAALIMNSDAAEHLLVQLLRKPPTCSQFIESLSSLNRFDLLETCLQGKILRLMLENIPLFAAYRLDTVLIPFIEKHMNKQSKSITFMLAHEVVLRWALHQPIDDMHEASAAMLLKVLEGSNTKKSLSYASASNVKRNLAKVDGAGDLPDTKRQRLETGYAGNTQEHCHDIQERAVSAKGSLSSCDHLLEGNDENPLIHSLSEAISEEKMAVMQSSLQHCVWLDSIDSNMLSPDAESRSVVVASSLTAESDKLLAGMQESAPQLAPKLTLFEVPNNEGKTEDTFPSTALISSNDYQKSLSKASLGLNAPKEEIVQSVAPIKDAQILLPTTKDTALNAHPVIPSGDAHGHYDVISACRAHRLQVLKSAAGKGVLNPKALQQLSQSASSLLIRIGNTECLTSTLEAATASDMPPSSQLRASELSQSAAPYSQSENNPEESTVHSLESYLIKSHSLLALNLHCAPDDLIAATSDHLLSKIDAQGRLNKWESNEQIRPFTAVLYLIGVLLVRIRILTAPASRLLFRALETAVKKAPDVAVTLLLPMIVKTAHKLAINLVQESTQPQYEILTRVTRQTLSAEQCNELVRCLCSQAMPASSRKDSTSLPGAGAVAVAANVIMLTILSAHTSESSLKAASSSSGKGGQNNKKKAGTSTESTSDLSTAEQNAHYVRWTACIHTHPSFTSQHSVLDFTSVWCESMGFRPDRPPVPDPEFFRTIDTILKKITVLHLATAQSLSDLLELFADDITLPSTHTIQADVRMNLASSVVSVLYTLVTRFPKVVIEGAVKKSAVSLLSRCGSSTVSKAALTAYLSLS